VVLVCISFMARYGEHFFMCFFAIWRENRSYNNGLKLKIYIFIKFRFLSSHTQKISVIIPRITMRKKIKTEGLKINDLLDL
jgi:hypothetical protein